MTKKKNVITLTPGRNCKIYQQVKTDILFRHRVQVDQIFVFVKLILLLKTYLGGGVIPSSQIVGSLVIPPSLQSKLEKWSEHRSDGFGKQHKPPFTTLTPIVPSSTPPHPGHNVPTSRLSYTLIGLWEPFCSLKYLWPRWTWPWAATSTAPSTPSSPTAFPQRSSASSWPTSSWWQCYKTFVSLSPTASLLALLTPMKRPNKLELWPLASLCFLL